MRERSSTAQRNHDMTGWERPGDHEPPATPPRTPRGSWWVYAILGWGVVAGVWALVRYEPPAPSPPRSPTRLAPSKASAGTERNLLCRDERDLRVGVCRGDVAAAYTLVDDIGYDYVEAATRAYISPRGSNVAVRILARALHLSPAEQEAWKIMLPELCRYEFSPSWQKAGVPRETEG
jgi:hypothetical protein